jgi:hypothetical protein
MSTSPDLIIRTSTSADRPALERLALLDSRPQPGDGSFLLAEASGELIAAVSLDQGDVIADPFKPTAGAVAVLRMRAEESARPARGRRRLIRRPVARRRAAAPA